MCSIMGFCDRGVTVSEMKRFFDRTISRGPDDSRIIDTGKGLLGFHRLAIMGLHPEGMQPFELDGSYVVCNGEIYGFPQIEKEADGDRQIHLRQASPTARFCCPCTRSTARICSGVLDAEFALILYDGDTQSYIAARDPIGIRPLYYGYDPHGVDRLRQRAQEPGGSGGRDHALPSRTLL